MLLVKKELNIKHFSQCFSQVESSLLLLFDSGEGRGYKFSKQSASERPKYLILKAGSW